MRDDRLVELITAHAQAAAENNSSQGDDRDFAGATTNVDDHVSRRFMHRQTDPDGRSHGLFDQINFARAGVSCGIFYRTFFNFGNAGGNSDDHPGSNELAMMNLLDEMPQHRFGDFEIGDDAVFHRPNGYDISGGASKHPLGFLADRQHVSRASLDRDNGRFSQDNSLVTDVYQGICSPEINTDIVGKQAFKLREHE